MKVVLARATGGWLAAATLKVVGVSALSVAGLAGCGLELIPFSDPAPRSFALPRLVRQCRGGFTKPRAVEILDRGAAPRRVLRFLPDKDSEARLTLVGGDEAGPLRVDHVLDVSWDALGVKGQGCYAFRLVGALDAELEAESGPVMGVIGVGPHGAMTVGTDALDDASYRVEGALFHRIVAAQPLVPAEPIGIGAKWQFSTEGHLRGEYVDIDATYELLELEASRVRLGVQRRLRRPEQTVRGRKGEGRRVEAMDETRWGVVEVDLRRSPLPTARWFDETGREVEQLLVAWRSDG